MVFNATFTIFQLYRGSIILYIGCYIHTNSKILHFIVSSTNKTDRHDITEIVLKVALNMINETKPSMETDSTKQIENYTHVTSTLFNWKKYNQEEFVTTTFAIRCYQCTPTWCVFIIFKLMFFF